MISTNNVTFCAFQVAPAGEQYEREFLSLVASVFSHSNSLMAEKVVSIAKKNHFAIYPVIGFRDCEEQGLGAAVEVSQGVYRAVVIGKRNFLKDLGLNIPELLEVASRQWVNEGAEVLYAGWDGWIRGILKFKVDS